jgi:shikimate kinase
MTPRVVLVGLPGAGKTTTGRRLARILHVRFADSDHLVSRAGGRAVPDIFASDGEAAFRAMEAEAVSGALTGFDGVLAIGGGALTTERTRVALAASPAPVVLLRTTVPTLVQRVGDGTSRPLLQTGPAERLQVLAAEREADYLEVATLVVDTDGSTPGQVAAQVAALLKHAAGDKHAGSEK